MSRPGLKTKPRTGARSASASWQRPAAHHLSQEVSNTKLTIRQRLQPPIRNATRVIIGMQHRNVPPVSRIRFGRISSGTISPSRQDRDPRFRLSIGSPHPALPRPPAPAQSPLPPPVQLVLGRARRRELSRVIGRLVFKRSSNRQSYNMEVSPGVPPGKGRHPDLTILSSRWRSLFI